MTTILGFGLVWWTGIIGGILFLLLTGTALVKQYNCNIFMKYQIPLTPFHHWFGWFTFGILFVHFVLALLSSVFYIYV